MPSPTLVPNPALSSEAGTIYVSVTNPKVVVEYLGEAELRIGETKHNVVIYDRSGRFYVRLKAEFAAKFTANH
jgi:hypothetical protein